MARDDAQSVLGYLAADTVDRIQYFKHFAEIDSTNSWLLRADPPEAGWLAVAVANHQTAGRGRFERRWHSRPGSSACLSLAYTFASTRSDIAGLAIAAGVGIADALGKMGASDITLKWPNDIMTPSGKLAGILAESRTVGAATTVVVGLGINLTLDGVRGDDPDDAWFEKAADLTSCCADLPTRAAIIAALLDGMTAAIVSFEQDGVGPFVAAWRRYDHLRGLPVVVESAGDDEPEKTTGIAHGIDDDGAMLLLTPSGSKRILAGSVRLDQSADAA